ncbi:hypothetical protein AB0D37_07115 [Streptomyces sp. NPDC048384]|uniref:hypothetical protein n=1 Tax=Streptomyces sp. NPDC048384 TaxID=3155487 RepID=UPI003416CF42
MATYVAVSNESYDKAIKAGPFELDDPSQYPVQEGTHLMLESEARAAGYYYASDGAFAPEQPVDGDDDHQDDEAQAGRGGQGPEGNQGPEGGQGAQTQPGGQGKPGKHNHQ